MFIGTYDNSIDAKNRVIIPAKFREELGYKVVLTVGIDKCLYLYPYSEWERFAIKLSALPISDERARKFSRSFVANAEECEVDRQGRLTIPAKLRKIAGISKELTTVGYMDKIEIWSREEYKNFEDDSLMQGEQLAKGMLEYGI
ncbi:MAG: division/cell wall cluster transcriptional repressor MraZ [Eubacteriales bacterium]|nr:division/cell wall cluster transcriptional repressor MraZ [Eubacteriales bacterium]MDY3332158.1 division/cell wall cluster transcriptional repressor MraZ [Gallibacter sp.]